VVLLQIVTSPGFLVIDTGVFKLITALPLTVPALQLASLTLAIVYVVAAFGFTVIVYVPLELNVLLVPSFITTVIEPVPVTTTLSVAAVLAQIVWLPLSVAVGNGLTVTVAVPAVKVLTRRTHPLASVTLTNV
jgi:hypothetical protein